MGGNNRYHNLILVREGIHILIHATTEPTIEKNLALGSFKPEKGTKLEEAVHYSLGQKEFLCAFLSHGAVEISSHQVENAIRPFVVGRVGCFAIPQKARQPARWSTLPGPPAFRF